MAWDKCLQVQPYLRGALRELLSSLSIHQAWHTANIGLDKRAKECEQRSEHENKVGAQTQHLDSHGV
jgi:hypothetical protein